MKKTHEEHQHYFRFFREDADIAREVTDFVGQGLDLGEPSILALEPQNALAVRKLIEERFGYVDGSVQYLDAELTANTVAREDGIDAGAFRSLMTPALESAIARSKTGRARVYGEIVNVLWSTGREKQAAALEGAWTKLGREYPFHLFCGYKLDLLDCRCDVWDIVQAHDALLPENEMKHIYAGIDKVADSVLGSDAAKMRRMISADPRLGRLPFGQAALIWLGHHIPITLDRLLAEVKPMQ